jgi:hypothetical protein
MADEDLPPSYVKSCEKFLKSLKLQAWKPQASSSKRHEPDTIK